MNSDLKPNPASVRYGQPRPFTAKPLPSLAFPKIKTTERKDDVRR
jgi:hypothetical protein